MNRDTPSRLLAIEVKAPGGRLLTERVLRAIIEFDRSLFAVRFGVGR